MVDTTVAFEGWGRSLGWGISPFGTGSINIAMAGSVGSPTVTPQIVVNISSGIAATGNVGQITAVTNAAVVTGVAALGQVGNVIALPTTEAFVVGSFATGYSGQVLVWGQIIPDQSPGWSEVDPSDAPGWTQIVPSQSSNWTEIIAA